jgi:phage baseplate assembly protein W
MPSGLRLSRLTVSASDSAFLGRGWAFPPAFDALTGRVEMVEAEEDIRQSMLIILSTEPGERAMRPRFGCPLRQFFFQRLDLTMQTRIKDTVFHALLHWEPRIVVDAIRVEEGAGRDGSVRIAVDYTVRSTNSRFNLVLPYHLAEGSRRLG